MSLQDDNLEWSRVWIQRDYFVMNATMQDTVWELNGYDESARMTYPI